MFSCPRSKEGPRRRIRSPEHKSPRSKEEPRDRNRSPEHMSPRSSCNRGRRLSQDAMCECWDCGHKLQRSMEAMEDPMETGRRRMRVQITWIPEEQDRFKDQIEIKRVGITKEQDFISNRPQEGVTRQNLQTN